MPATTSAPLRPEPVKEKKQPAAAAGGAPKLSRPDQTAYKSEQDALDKEIGVVREELNTIKSRLALLHAPKSDEPTDRRSQIKAEMDELQGRQGASKADRGKTLDAIKRHQDTISTKSTEIASLRSKLPYRNASEIQSRINALNTQVESGTLKLIDEKKALNEISVLRRSTKQVNTIETLEASIAEEKAKVDELRKVLDDPKNKATQARWDELRAEMDQMREEGKKAYEERGGLFDKRNALQAKMDELYDRKRAANTKNRSENDAYRAAVDAERKAKNDKYKAERAAEDAARQTSTIERMREEAKEPAFDREIEDCGVLIGWFERQYGSGVEGSNAAEASKEQGGLLSSIKGAIDGIKSLDLRQVASDQPEGNVLKKDRDDLEGWGAFAGNGGKKKGGKGGKKAAANGTPASATPAAATSTSTPAAASSANSNISLPFSTLNTLLGFGISPPANKDDVSRVVNDLSTKKAWFEANQKRKTEEEVERVEKQIQKMLKKNGGAGGATEVEEPESIPKEAGGKKEPMHTVAVDGDATTDILAEQGEQLPETPEERSQSVHQIDEELEQVVKEEEDAGN